MTWHLSTQQGPVDQRARNEVIDLAAACEAQDGAVPFGDDNLLGAAPAPHAIYLRADDTDDLLGYAVVSAGTAEFAVHPAHRQTGLGRNLAAEAIRLGATAAWAHGDLPGAQRLAAEVGATPARELLILAVAATDITTGEQPPGPGYTLRPYAGRGDDAALLTVNRAAFVDLPDQGSWTVADLHARIGASWFHPADLLLLVSEEEAADPGIVTSDGSLAGFHWTKVHATGACEVYVVALHPQFQGRGLASGLITAGLTHLLTKNCPEVMLYVDSQNAAALTAYRRLGFMLSRRDILYAGS